MFPATLLFLGSVAALLDDFALAPSSDHFAEAEVLAISNAAHPER